jgi:hypothetical protein
MDKIVMFESNEAAQYKTGLSGWVSSNGHYWGEDERAARYDGCTHRACEDCGQPTEKSWLVCAKCRDIREVKKHTIMPRKEWDEKGMLYSDTADKYFQDWDEVEDYCVDEETTIEKLRLVICEPQYLPLLDAGDYGCDELAEDGELPDKVIEAIDKFNKVIKTTKPISWYPGEYAVIIPEPTVGDKNLPNPAHS